MRIGTITSTLKRSPVDCRLAAGGLLLRGRNVRPHILWNGLGWINPTVTPRSFLSRRLPAISSSVAVTGVWNMFSEGVVWFRMPSALPMELEITSEMETRGITNTKCGNTFITSLFSLFQFASKCSMWTVMGFCLEMSSMKWWWPCWRCGRTIAQTHFL